MSNELEVAGERVIGGYLSLLAVKDEIGVYFIRLDDDKNGVGTHRYYGSIQFHNFSGLNENQKINVLEEFLDEMQVLTAIYIVTTLGLTASGY